MKKTADKKGMAFLLKNLEDKDTLVVEFEEQPEEKVREVDSKHLHLALGTMEMGERLLVRFNGSNE